MGQFYDGDAYYVSVLHLQIWLLNWDGAFVFIVFLTFLICSDTCVGTSILSILSRCCDPIVMLFVSSIQVHRSGYARNSAISVYHLQHDFLLLEIQLAHGTTSVFGCQE